MTRLQHVCETIEKVRGHLAGNQIRVEADVESYVLSPLLRDLGWDPEDPGSVKRQYPARGGKRYRFDYALMAADGAVAFVIEAKAPGKLDTDARDQLLLYAMNTETNLGLTTDGEIWSFWLPLGGGSSKQRLVRTVNLTSDTAERASNLLLRYLAQDRVLSGDAHDAARGDLASLAIQRLVAAGWADLLDASKEKLVRTIAAAARTAATRKGVKAPSGRALNEAARAFVGHGFAFPADLPTPAVDAPSRRSPAPAVRPPAEAKRAQRSQGGAAWIYRGERHAERNLTEVFVAVVGHLYETQGGVSFYKKLQEEIRGPKRLQIARTPEDTGVTGGKARQLPGGWYISTNFNSKTKQRYLERACKVAGVAFGSDLVIEIAGAHGAGPWS